MAKLSDSLTQSNAIDRPASSSDGSDKSTYALLNKNYNQTSETATLAFTFPYNASLNAGSRAMEAFVRPSPVVVAGIPKSYGFDMRSCSFSMTMAPYEEDPSEDAPTEIFIPEYFFQDGEPEINLSSGRWLMHRSGQVLQWWHSGSGEQSITISSPYRKEGVVGTADEDDNGWYYSYGRCGIM
jgi:hypothetical protein